MKWMSKLIGDFVDAGHASIQTGPFGTQLRASDYVSEGTPVINVRNIGFAKLRPEQLEYVGEPYAEQDAETRHKGIEAALRRAAAKALELGIRTNTAVWVIRDGKIVDARDDQKAS